MSFEKIYRIISHLSEEDRVRLFYACKAFVYEKVYDMGTEQFAKENGIPFDELEADMICFGLMGLLPLFYEDSYSL